jgi:hypothetical protein
MNITIDEPPELGWNEWASDTRCLWWIFWGLKQS